jgi:hypothetical protein
MTILRPQNSRFALPALSFSPRIVAAMLAIAALGLRIWTPTDDQATTVCLFRRCTGTSCPGCGLTRGMAHVVRGDFAAAWHNHPLAILIAIEAVVAAALFWFTSRGRIRFDWMRLGTLWLAAHIPLLIGVWAIRIVTGTLPA